MVFQRTLAKTEPVERPFAAEGIETLSSFDFAVAVEAVASWNCYETDSQAD